MPQTPENQSPGANGSAERRESGRSAAAAADEPRASPADDPSDGEPQRRSPLDGLESDFSELLAYAVHYLGAESDWIQWRAAAIAWRVVVLAGASLAAVGMAATAAVFVMRGLAGGLAELCDIRPWAAELITGGTFFLVVGGGQAIAFALIRWRWRERILRKYERFRQRERWAFGHDVGQAGERQAD